ncbi:MAG TPA: hypothetical protein VFW96_29450, partial [Thermomicrobiales bacterium]|nr:hypothetical protein [Thermomicrobiales bacterium]
MVRRNWHRAARRGAARPHDALTRRVVAEAEREWRLLARFTHQQRQRLIFLRWLYRVGLVTE